MRRVVVASRSVTTLAGSGSAGSNDGVGTNARFYYPWGVATTADGATVYVAETTADRIRKIEVSSGTVTTLAGYYNSAAFIDGVGTTARFKAPRQIALTGGTLLVADTSSRRIRQVEVSTGMVTTMAGTGAASSQDGAADVATFYSPTGIAATTNGMLVLITDDAHHRVRRFLPQALYPFPPLLPHP